MAAWRRGERKSVCAGVGFGSLLLHGGDLALCHGTSLCVCWDTLIPELGLLCLAVIG